jgi:hypothetical protein
VREDVGDQHDDPFDRPTGAGADERKGDDAIVRIT